jgi:hypothetical protein
MGSPADTLKPRTKETQSAGKPTRSSGAIGLFQKLGPGLVTGASGDDPRGIGTYLEVGASEQATLGATGSKLTGGGGVSLGWSRSCDQLLDHHAFGPNRHRRRLQNAVKFKWPNFLAGQGRCWTAVQSEMGRSFGRG